MFARHGGKRTLTPNQWSRVSALLQRQRLPASFLWRFKTCVRWTRRSAFEKSYLVSEDPFATVALTRIEFLWQDLDTVQAWLQDTRHDDVEWVAAEVDRRRQWFTGLRRAWLLAASG
jgi:hypothetical protein